MKILVVDDSTMMRTLIKNALKKCGYESVYEAMDGDQALKQLRSKQFDVILLDWLMPNMDGMTFFKTLRQEDKSTTVLMLTSQSDRTHVTAAVRAGVDGYLLKPVKWEELKDRIEEAIDRRKKALESLSE